MTKLSGSAAWAASVTNIFDAGVILRMNMVASLFPYLGPAAGLQLSELLRLATQKAFLVRFFFVV
jgi:hypothetical protein